ncbi:PREDICTED: potassium channel subfamily K member 1-like isoform X1 [Branchiostoma belcheri]|uniref:Potassium channel subfamily K member n=1 Tax=Branchiostoma belcheri TaxID=7741 RepID=A0A6P4ZD42_BRABE|nr:PREDICTED: potassium channel subfamily K member 1-like isoform X1 [Branchiostoma belcheri]XP_019627595.1 PREDICTED: potassium channel subfamily K member 1-like isoform X2 [Branchiostoma belcheri]XP_019627596.1 PREDICTED: potassium channel subfamily K member 1-like isoform X2 [Branchiostoma belcheri]XP_019627597.1 PREDICTED: potassium channel subfamily K member 1-like isoform X1 [Branchiostoma belcheri]KAI8505640.1 Potassium channel sub K member 1 [Branchiostoma belcheri]
MSDTEKETCFLNRRTARLLVIIVIYTMYIVVGAIIFCAIEGPEERQTGQRVRDFRAGFLEKNQCVTDAELEELILEVIHATHRGVAVQRNVTGPPAWSFAPAMFFAGSTITTIGYGHVVPLSDGGKIFCLVYCTVGIPLTLLLFGMLVSRMNTVSYSVLEMLHKRFGEKADPGTMRIVHFAIVASVSCTTVIFLPALVFTLVEVDWSYFDALYYCIISLTTVGLGDYVPGENIMQKQRDLYKICSTVYLVFGLAVMLLVLDNASRFPEFRAYLSSLSCLDDHAIPKANGTSPELLRQEEQEEDIQLKNSVQRDYKSLAVAGH